MKIRIILLIFLVVALTSPIKAIKISASPAHLDFNENANEEICKTISVFSDENVFIEIEDKWTILNNSASLNDYNLTSGQFEINVSYPNGINLIKEKKVDVCITSKNPGTYNGILIFKSTRVLAGIAVLIKVETSESEKKFSLIPITGNIIKSDKENMSENFGPILMFISSLILVLVFFIIIRKK